MFPGGWKLEAYNFWQQERAPCLSAIVHVENWFRTLAAEEDEGVLLWEECMLDASGHGIGTKAQRGSNKC